MEHLRHCATAVIRMIIRLATEKDIPAWLEIARRGDEAVSRIADLAGFYRGFSEYMASKIRKQEAFLAEDRDTRACLGVVAISEGHNRVSFLGLEAGVEFFKVAAGLLETALNQLDNGRAITASVLKIDADIVRQEKDLYQRFGFIEQPGEVMEKGVPAVVMRLPGILEDMEE